MRQVTISYRDGTGRNDVFNYVENTEITMEGFLYLEVRQSDKTLKTVWISTSVIHTIRSIPQPDINKVIVLQSKHTQPNPQPTAFPTLPAGFPGIPQEDEPA